MAKLIYSISTSLDGFIEDKAGNFDWAGPSEEVHAAINEKVKNVGTFLLGRRMYETLAVWDIIPFDGPSEAVNQYSMIWRAADKIVFSNSRIEVSTSNTIVEREFNARQIQKLIAESEKDFGIGGAHLAGDAVRAGMVDEFHQYIVPKTVGGGTHWLPKNVEAELELIELQKFENGTVFLHYKHAQV